MENKMYLSRLVLVVFIVTFYHPLIAFASKASDNKKVVEYTRLLENNPFDLTAPKKRAWLLEWEDKSKDVIDIVCPGVLSPLPNNQMPYNGELLAQFIFGSASFQLENPSEKGKLVPQQIAGMRSLLKAYGAIVSAKPEARIPHFDELTLKDSQGSLEEFLLPVIASECK
jgi:hypothetical protein